MSSIERRLRGKNTYLTFIKKFSFMGKPFAIKKHIGKEVATITLEGYLIDNLDEISKEEFKVRNIFLDPVKRRISHNDGLAERIERKAIRINNLQEAKYYPRPVLSDFSIKFIYNSRSHFIT